MFKLKVFNSTSTEIPTNEATFPTEPEALSWFEQESANGSFGKPAWTEVIPAVTEMQEVVITPAELDAEGNVITEAVTELQEVVITPEQVIEHPAEFTYTIEDISAQVARQNLIQLVANARAFGNKMINEFAADNIVLGITQDGKTGEVLTKMQGVISALESGSLYEAIARAKAIPESDYDAKYVTPVRILSFVNEIETYLGLPLSTQL